MTLVVGERLVRRGFCKTLSRSDILYTAFSFCVQCISCGFGYFWDCTFAVGAFVSFCVAWLRAALPVKRLQD